MRTQDGMGCDAMGRLRRSKGQEGERGCRIWVDGIVVVRPDRTLAAANGSHVHSNIYKEIGSQ